MGYTPRWTEAAQLKPGDFLVARKPLRSLEDGPIEEIQIGIEKTLWKQKIEDVLSIPLDENFGELVGLYLAEGYARPKVQMGLCYHAEEIALHSRSVELIKECFGLDASVKFPTKTSAVVEFNEICIAAHLRDMLGHSCYTKHIPSEWIYRANIEFLRGILRGFLWGDGTKCQPRSMGYTTTSARLAMQIQQIGMLCGIYFGISPRNGSTESQHRETSYVGVCSGIYDNKVRNLLGLPERETDRSWSGVIEDGEYFYVKINSVATEEYSGIVHCLQVGSFPSFTLANGIITHNCYAHSDFFRNNMLFKEIDETQMVDVAKRHAVIIEQFRDEYGEEVVGHWLDVALALEHHIDVYKGRRRKRYPTRQTIYKEREVKPYEDIVHINDKEPIIQKVIEGIHIPPRPERDLLWFLSEYASLEPWQQKIFEIVRREAYYFYPMFRTKIMNEGWASYWHKELMDQYALGDDNDYGVKEIKYPLTNEEHLDFLTHHEKVVQPGLKVRMKEEVDEVDHTGRPTGKKVKVWSRVMRENPHIFSAATRINPYYVGFRMFRDIKKRWDEYYEQGYREDEWDRKIPVTIDGAQKIREVMMEEDDVSFMRNYLTEDLAHDLNLFMYGSTEKYRDDYGTQEKIKERFKEAEHDDLGSHAIDEQYIENKTIVVQSKELKEVIRGFAWSRNNYGVPEIVVRRVDEAGLLRLEHSLSDPVNLDLAYAEHVLKYVYQAWRRPIELIRKASKDATGDQKTWVLSYNGHQFDVDFMEAGYPDEIEETDVPSSW
jgi:stage V sporulation protein R